MADRRKLAQGLMMMTPAMREDLAGREQDIQRGKTVELLRRAGKEMYDNPIVNTAIGFTPGVGDVQAAGETFAALQRGAPWQETAGYAVGMLPFVPALRTTWHGSPHGFTKFDMSKIGTGEGSQAFAHGLYLAEAPETAKSYQAMANNPARRQGGLRGEGKEQAMMDSLIRLNAKKYTEGDVNKLAELVAQHPAAFTNPEKMIARIGEYENNVAPSYLYKVDLPDEQIAKMFDWDNPISEEMRKPISNAMMEKFGSGLSLGTGEQAYKQIVDEFRLAGSKDPRADASQWLYQQGVPGVQYLDEASRGAGEGTRNYVVFSDEIPQILERNNQPVAQALREYKQLESLNPTGTVMTEYNPLERASLPLGKNLTTLDVTSGVSPDEMVEIYRGVPQGVSEISPGDFITTNRQLAQDYAGGGNVISQKVPYRTILDDLTEPLGEEYIYRP